MDEAYALAHRVKVYASVRAVKEVATGLNGWGG